MPASERMFKGRTTAERRADRQERLNEAALDIIGTRGWSEATMTEICRTAGLTERYFYESYRNRDELYLALLDRLAGEAQDAFVTALSAGPADPRERITAACRAIVDVLITDPRKGRAALSEGLESPTLQDRRREIIHAMGDVLRHWHGELFGHDDDPDRTAMRVAAISGATTEVLTQRLAGAWDLSDDVLAGRLADLTLALLRA